MASPLLSIPPDCGRRLLPVLVDDISKTNGGRPFISIPRSPKLQDGYVDISYSTFAKAVNRCCWLIEKTIGRSEISKVLFYIGPLDLRYLLFLFAASKTGHVVSLPALVDNLNLTPFIRSFLAPIVTVWKRTYPFSMLLTATRFFYLMGPLQW